MTTRLFLGLSLVFAFLQGPILPAVFTEGLLVVFLLVTLIEGRVAPALLLSGLLFDFLQNQTLGVTSIIFLATALFLHVLGDRVQIQKAYILSLIAVLINVVRSKILFGYIEMFPLILIFSISYLVFSFVWRPQLSGGIRLK